MGGGGRSAWDIDISQPRTIVVLLRETTRALFIDGTNRAMRYRSVSRAGIRVDYRSTIAEKHTWMVLGGNPHLRSIAAADPPLRIPSKLWRVDAWCGDAEYAWRNLRRLVLGTNAHGNAASSHAIGGSPPAGDRTVCVLPGTTRNWTQDLNHAGFAGSY